MKGGFPVADTMLAGPRMLRREPGLLLSWTLAALALGLADQVMAVGATMGAGDAATLWTAPMVDLARGVVVVVGMAILSAAVYRTILRPEGEAWGRLRLGPDEVRLTLVWLLQGLMLVVLSIVAVIPAAFSMRIFNEHAMLAGLANGVVFLVAFVAWTALAVRLSLAAPMAVAEGRWSGPAAWRMSKGHGWRILAVHLPLLLGVGLVLSLSRTLYQLALSAMGVDLASMFTAKARSMAEVFAPARLGFTLVTAILGAVAAPTLYAPAACIYRALRGGDPADQAAVFD